MTARWPILSSSRFAYWVTMADHSSFVTAGFDALPANVAILDAEGVIVYTNASWDAFGETEDCPRQRAGSGPTISRSVTLRMTMTMRRRRHGEYGRSRPATAASSRSSIPVTHRNASAGLRCRPRCTITATSGSSSSCTSISPNGVGSSSELASRRIAWRVRETPLPRSAKPVVSRPGAGGNPRTG